VERSAHPQLDAREGEQLLPERAGEDGVTVTDDEAWDAMELDNVVEECASEDGVPRSKILK
jgi:hypothetical protein